MIESVEKPDEDSQSLILLAQVVLVGGGLTANLIVVFATSPLPCASDYFSGDGLKDSFSVTV